MKHALRRSPPAPDARAEQDPPKRPPSLATESPDALSHSASRTECPPFVGECRLVLLPAHWHAAASSRASPLRPVAGRRRTSESALDLPEAGALVRRKCGRTRACRIRY